MSAVSGMSDASAVESPRAGRWLLGMLAALLLVRLLSLALYPLMDNTEARYADIGRRMVETGNWVTPWFADGVPFWGKPPLSFWATAIGFKLFGLNEMAARLPHLLLAAGVAVLVWLQGRQSSPRQAWHSVALLWGSTLFLVASGAVMTDMALTLGTTLVMLGFWRAVNAADGDRVAAWQLVLGASIGLLAKGPISVILWGVPVVVWVLLTGRLALAWRRIAWLRGAALVLLLSLPWYLWAELRTPGFLRYFIVGEHWHRFVTPGWSGDLYGTAHQFPRGSIWPFALLGILPWTLLLPLVWWRARRAAADAGAVASGGEAAYLWAWVLTPCVFFTFSGNILWTYVLPGLPALALLGGRWTASRARQDRVEGLLTAGLAICMLTIVGGLIYAARVPETIDRKSARALVADYRAQGRPDRPLYYLGKAPSSASFYSRGQVRDLASLADLPAGQVVFVIVDQPLLATLAPEIRVRATPVATRGGRVLLLLQR
jgi:4-amino-4-deoxy-L-arabinose transferase-like glycosyltransferase